MDYKQRTAAVEAFHEAVGRAKTQTAFAREVGLLQQTVSNLLRRGDLLPAEAVLAAERAYGVSCHLLRPDIYPPAAPLAYVPAEDLTLPPDALAADFDRAAKMKHGGEA